MVKNLPGNAIPGSRRSPGVGNDNPPSILAWKIPWTELHGGLQSVGLHRVGCDWARMLYSFRQLGEGQSFFHFLL